MPHSFRAMPRWWHGNASWLDALPRLVEKQLALWGLVVDGEVRHGSNSLVVPVLRAGEPLVLRLTPPSSAFGEEVAALRFWDGHGTVRLLAADVPAGAMLLERLDASRSAQDLPLDEAVAVLGQMMRRLAVPPPARTTTTAALARQRLAELTDDWNRLGRPFPQSMLAMAYASGRVVAEPATDLAANGDLHFQQVLRTEAGAWTCVDPRLLRGDIEYDLARVLWSRLDEMADDAEIHRHLQTAVHSAGLDAVRARHWVLFRTVDYWLWGLARGLTEDPQRCDRLANAVAFG